MLNYRQSTSGVPVVGGGGGGGGVVGVAIMSVSIAFSSPDSVPVARAL